MRSGCDDRKKVTFSSFAAGASSTAALPDRCEMCGGDGPVLECEMSGSGLDYRLYICARCGRELVEEMATITDWANRASGAS